MNAASGRLDAEARRDAVVAVLRDAGREHLLLEAPEPSALTEVARDAVRRALERGGAVVAAGGDGTINAVAQQVLGSGRPLGLLPQGTFNYFGRAHGVPTEPEAAARALLRARPVPIRVGRVGGRVFLVNASVGLYPNLLEDREAWKRRWGRSRPVALLAALATLARGVRPLRLELTTGGATRTVRTSTLFVGNNPLQLERLGMEVDDSIGDGRLAAIVVPPYGGLRLLWLALRGAVGGLGEASPLVRLDVERLVVRPSRLGRRTRIRVATDGEVLRLPVPLRIEVDPEPLRLLVPAPEDAVEVR
ncbi:MAG: diacylglycerol kinase [Burkholderiales bacterium]|jgi:diacylglycerol kinase family enzyme|nr:diacylglycerol kinase [Burkholderiales bacterium]